MFNLVQLLANRVKSAGENSKMEKSAVVLGNSLPNAGPTRLGQLAGDNKTRPSHQTGLTKELTNPYQPSVVPKPAEGLSSFTGNDAVKDVSHSPVRSSVAPVAPKPSQFTRIPRTTEPRGVGIGKVARNTGISDCDGNLYVNTEDVELLGKLGFSVDVDEYIELEKTSEVYDLYSYIEKEAGVPKAVSKAVDKGEAFSGSLLADMGYSVPEGYEIKSDLCCPIEKKAGEKAGLWANVHAKKARGEKAAKPGDEAYPDKEKRDKLSNPGQASPSQNPVQIPNAPLAKQGESELEKVACLVKEASRLRDNVNITSHSDPSGLQEYKASIGDKQIGNMLVADVEGKGKVVAHSVLEPEFRGMGLGKKLYGEVMRRQPDGVLHSGPVVSDDASRVWDSMKRNKGYSVAGEAPELAGQINSKALNIPNKIKKVLSAPATSEVKGSLLSRIKSLLGRVKKAEATHELKSSNIKAVGYDKKDKALEVHFHSGGEYKYSDVPASLFHRLLKVKSPGKFFHKHIKKDNSYSYEKLAAKTPRMVQQLLPGIGAFNKTQPFNLAEELLKRKQISGAHRDAWVSGALADKYRPKFEEMLNVIRNIQPPK